eukprot:TRINITY_DN3433_c0_g1_i1.p1 TRINITY_DN3433_c0_g1~~TRINITY_DN3433_c0_g1_i1.p1  ORF type:complete len:567 (+),score=166.75 TRINITY_DN3433_c0_g1_i1:82-1701(+)
MAVQRVVVAGTGVAGLSTAMHLVRHLSAGGRKYEVVLVDPRPPMTATSSVSTECYRGFFLDKALTPFISRSIDIIEELQKQHGFAMSRRGYAFLCASAEGHAALRRFGETAAAYGAGELRVHPEGAPDYYPSPAEGWDDPQLTGFDYVEGSEAIQRIFPFVSPEATCLLHCRRAGWLDAYGLGGAYLAGARQLGGVRSLAGSVKGFDRCPATGDVTAVRVQTKRGAEDTVIECDAFVNAAGPWVQSVNHLLAPHAPLPVKNEIHAKVVLPDVLEVIPQTAPFMIWRDGIDLDFGQDWRDELADLDNVDQGGDENALDWIRRQPGGIHFRPAGNGRVLILWEHIHRHIDVSQNPRHPPTDKLFHDVYPELCVGGLKVMVPEMGKYEANITRDTSVDGGYYTVTPDGRPIIGPYGARNCFVCCGFNGWGVMASGAAGEVAALHALGKPLPEYAADLTLRCPPPRAPHPPDLLDESVGDADAAEAGDPARQLALSVAVLEDAERVLERAAGQLAPGRHRSEAEEVGAGVRALRKRLGAAAAA